MIILSFGISALLLGYITFIISKKIIGFTIPFKSSLLLSFFSQLVYQLFLWVFMFAGISPTSLSGTRWLMHVVNFIILFICQTLFLNIFIKKLVNKHISLSKCIQLGFAATGITYTIVLAASVAFLLAMVSIMGNPF